MDHGFQILGESQQRKKRMGKKSSNSKIILLLAVLAVIVAAALLLRATLKKPGGIDRSLRLAEYTRKGNAAFFILGDYFHEAFAKELGSILLDLPINCTTYIACNERMRGGLTTWTSKEGLPQPVFYTAGRTDAIMKVWARDIVVSATDGERTRLVVAPDIHARTESEAAIFSTAARELFPEDYDIVLAPFAFEGGNLIFVERGDTRILLAGKKILFDNARYQRKPWTPGWSGDALLENMRKFFDVDSVVVVGLAQQPPPLELYFEYHLDMGMAVLRDNTAVVAQFTFGDRERRQLRDAVDNNHPIVASLFERDRDREEIYGLLSDRLSEVSREYDHYAAVAGQLDLSVVRSPMEWTHAASFRSWTNVVQAGPRLFVPIYPESLNAAAEIGRDERGSITRQIQLEAVANDQFMLTGYNLRNKELYESMGYQVILIPEYLHYFEGGMHCFANILN